MQIHSNFKKFTPFFGILSLSLLPLFASFDVNAAEATKPAVTTAPPTAPTPVNEKKTVEKVDAKAAATKPTDAKTLPPIAQVIWVKGVVKAMQPKQAPRILERRSVIYEHDRITTDTGSTGQISFTDGSTLALNKDTDMTIDTYNYKKGSPKDSKSVFNFVKGGFRTITGAIPKDNPDGYQIKTPVATIGVRGTQYSGVISPKKGLLLQIEAGKIQVSNAAGKLELEKCSKGAVNCKQYGVVRDFRVAPASTAIAPPELAGQPQLKAVPSNWGAPGEPGPAGSPSVPGSKGPGSGGPSKTVSNFCVG